MTTQPRTPDVEQTGARAAARTRVLQVIGTMHVGGAERVVAHLSLGLDRACFDVTVCCTRETGALSNELARQSVPVILAAPGHRHLRHLTPLYLYREIARTRPDVIHTHGTAGMLHAGPLAAMRLLPHWIHTFHFGNYPELPSRQMRGERAMCRLADQLVAVSESQRQSIIRHHGAAPDRILTIMNGVSESPFLRDDAIGLRKRREFGIEPEETVVGCVAVLSVQKGITYLLQAAREILASRRNVRLLIIGGGPIETELRHEAAASGLGSRIVFTGWRDDYLEMMQALDVFVMTSLWEAMPMALLEAMAARRSIVVTDVANNREIVDGGACGVVVPPRDAGAVARAVGGLLDRPNLRRELSERAFQRFKAHYTVPHMVSHYERLYTRRAREERGGR